MGFSLEWSGSVNFAASETCITGPGRVQPRLTCTKNSDYNQASLLRTGWKPYIYTTAE